MVSTLVIQTDHLDHLDHLDQLKRLKHLDYLDHLGHLNHLDHPAHLDIPEPDLFYGTTRCKKVVWINNLQSLQKVIHPQREFANIFVCQICKIFKKNPTVYCSSSAS